MKKSEPNEWGPGSETVDRLHRTLGELRLSWLTKEERRKIRILESVNRKLAQDWSKARYR